MDTRLSAKASEGVTSWHWQILDAGGIEVKASTDPQQLTFKFPEAGTYTVRLKVSDAAAQEATTESTVEVTEQPKFEVARKKIQVGPAQPGNEAAACDKNMVALGGGVDFESDSAPSAKLQASFGTGDKDTLSGWTVALLNAGDAEGNFTINATCATAPSGYAVQTNTETSVEPKTSGDATASCPPGLVALGGGGGLGSDTVVVTQSVLEESLPVQDELGNWTLWRVRARNDAAAAQTLSAQVICGEEPDKYEVIAKPETVAAGTDSKVEHKPSCPAGSLALSGGAGLTTDIERDTGTQMVMHESTPTTAEAGSESQQWLTLSSVTSNAEQSVTGYAVCANLPH